VPVNVIDVSKTLRFAALLPSCVNVPVTLQLRPSVPLRVIFALFPIPLGITRICNQSATGELSSSKVMLLLRAVGGPLKEAGKGTAIKL
jgi:hypothetical protein